MKILGTHNDGEHGQRRQTQSVHDGDDDVRLEKQR